MKPHRVWSKLDRLWAELNRRWANLDRPRKYVAIAAASILVIACVVTGYYDVTFARVVDARLHGEQERVLPRVFARPLEIHRGQALTPQQFLDRLNDLGYAQRTQAENPGEFSVNRGLVALIPRAGDQRGKVVRVSFQRPSPPRDGRRAPAVGPPSTRIEGLEVQGVKQPPGRVTLDAPMLTALIHTGREKQRQVPLASIPSRMVQAVLAIEDRRFYSHLGIDPIRMVAAVFTNMRGDRPYLVGASTITQQLARNFFLTEEMAQEQTTGQRSLLRKIREQFMALILERKASKDEILELYLNDVYLGQRGSFAIHGVAEAARLYFGKDVSNVSLSEAATIAGIIQSPYALSPFNNSARALERRNVVLNAMADAGFISPDAAARAAKEPLAPVARALEAEAPYFVDFVGDTLGDQYPGLTGQAQAVDIYTTLDLHLQRLAQDAVRQGLTRVDELLSRRRRRPRPAEAALMAIDPRTGDVLAMVGGRSYNQSQYNRAVRARRQPGSVFKPFVYLAAFERAAAEGRSDLTPATLVNDEPTTFTMGETTWSPENYENEYDGEITLRRALALSRNVATIKVAETAGYDHVAELWRRVSTGTPPRPYPSIALGVFEATPYEIARAYTVFPNHGVMRDLRTLLRIARGGEEMRLKAPAQQGVARPDTTFLVTNMMRSVLNEGTGAGVRAAGFTLEAAGKTGTTNDLRDAWFVGFTPELLTVVWVGFDDNTALGLSGSQAALPIWTNFMIRALAGHPDASFEVPDNISFVDIDRDTGGVAGPGCPRVFREAFIFGTEPTQVCELHRY